MTVFKFIEKYLPKIFNIPKKDKKITGGYAGDFLSNVMSNIKEGALWFTVMSNVNVAAVASLTGCSAIIICQNVKPDKQLVDACKNKDIALFGTDLDVYSAILRYEIFL